MNKVKPWESTEHFIIEVSIKGKPLHEINELEQLLKAHLSKSGWQLFDNKVEENSRELSYIKTIKLL
jgi:hypothetical protein